LADELIVDLTNYKDRVGNRVVPGRYTVLVEDAELDKSQAGNDMVNLWLRVTGGEFDGATIVDRLTITEKALFRVVGFMQAIGLPTPRKRFKMNVRAFVGKTLDVDVEDGEPYNGRVKSEVRGYMRIAGGTQTAAAEDLPGADDLSAFTGEAQAEAATADPTPDPVAPEAPAQAEAQATEAAPAASEPKAEDADSLDLETIDLG
jgi:hypothetical protein